MMQSGDSEHENARQLAIVNADSKTGPPDINGLAVERNCACELEKLANDQTNRTRLSLREAKMQ